MNGPLSGVRVIDFATALAGPWAAGILADQGADVIKVERPEGGDIARTSGTIHKGVSAMYQLANRGKRSVVIDLATPEGRGVALELGAGADVVVQNFRPGVARRLGLDYEHIRALNENVIFASITGFGNSGPYAERRAYDSILQAYTGLTDLQAGADGEPQLLPHAELDKAASIFAAQAISAALFARERGQGGQRIDLSLMDTGVAFLWPDSAGTSTLLEADRGIPSAVTAGRRCISFSDGWAVISLSSGDDFRALCRILDIDPSEFKELGDRAGLAKRRDLVAIFMARMREQAKTRRFADVTPQLDAAGVPYARALRIAEVADDPQVRHNRILRDSIHPVAGRIREPEFPARFSVTPARIAGPSPRLGEHTDEVLSELRRRDGRARKGG
jgi:crotonobetainyl-CoA:carnitine CoA-transferase CaiB-like acyl-CoA transferase